MTSHVPKDARYYDKYGIDNCMGNCNSRPNKKLKLCSCWLCRVCSLSMFRVSCDFDVYSMFGGEARVKERARNFAHPMKTDTSNTELSTPRIKQRRSKQNVSTLCCCMDCVFWLFLYLFADLLACYWFGPCSLTWMTKLCVE
jgi:hypothetical protein